MVFKVGFAVRVCELGLWERKTFKTFGMNYHIVEVVYDSQINIDDSMITERKDRKDAWMTIRTVVFWFLTY